MGSFLPAAGSEAVIGQATQASVSCLFAVAHEGDAGSGPVKISVESLERTWIARSSPPAIPAASPGFDSSWRSESTPHPATVVMSVDESVQQVAERNRRRCRARGGRGRRQIAHGERPAGLVRARSPDRVPCGLRDRRRIAVRCRPRTARESSVPGRRNPTGSPARRRDSRVRSIRRSPSDEALRGEIQIILIGAKASLAVVLGPSNSRQDMHEARTQRLGVFLHLGELRAEQGLELGRPAAPNSEATIGTLMSTTGRFAAPAALPTPRATPSTELGSPLRRSRATVRPRIARAAAALETAC